jgi:hypothetical protein
MIPSQSSFHSAYTGEARTAGRMPVHDQNKPPSKAGGEEGGFLSFLKTVIDIINPLQHIPVVSTLYRQITGDEISPAARIAGDTLFGGPLGTMVALADVTSEKISGKDIGGNVMAMLSPDKKSEPAPTMLAQMHVKDIIWNNESPSSSLPPRQQMNGSEPALSPLYTEPVLVTKKAPVETAASTLLQLQEAPAVAGRKPAPPGPPAKDIALAEISTRMMHALDKYGAMKRGETAAAENRALKNYPMF